MDAAHAAAMAPSQAQDRTLRHCFSQYLESESGALASTLSQKIRRSKGDAFSIMNIVREAEVAHVEPNLLNKLLDEAMSSFGPVAIKLAHEDFCELCMKRLRLLCSLDPKEAHLFTKFLKKKGFCQQDARTHCAYAELALRAGHPEKAHKVLEDALAAGATPAEPLRSMLSRLLEASGTPEGGFKGSAAPEPSSRGNGSTPVRPRALRYSGGLIAPIPEEPNSEDAASGGAAASGSNREPLITDWVRRSSLDNLSPIVEADSVERSHLSESAAGLADSCFRRFSAGTAGARASDAASSRAQFPIVATGEAPYSEDSEAGDSDGSPKVADRGSSPMYEADSDTSFHSIDVSTGEAKQKARPIFVNGVAYVRRKTIGRGGSSKVFVVEDPSGRLFALKRVQTTCSSHFEALANEVTLLQQLKDCPHVIQVLNAQVSPEKGLIQIVMEKGDVDLKKILDSEQNLALGDIQNLWRQILEAVQVIHSKRIIHSDLKPANFLLVDGRLKLIDFGIAKRMPSETTHISREASVGTISYMAPEAVKQGSLKLGRPSDIWSLGIILYQMVYRHAPFAHLEPMQRIFQLADPNMAMNFPPEHRLEGHSDETKALLVSVLEQCLQRDPRRRPSIPELLQHPFLNDSVTVRRCAFDHTLRALVTGFCEAARSTLGVELSNDLEDVEVDSPFHGQWQLLADNVWDSMSQSLAGGLHKRLASDAEDRHSADTIGYAAYHSVLSYWKARGNCKRQRLDSTAVSGTVQGSLASAAASVAARSRLTSRPPPPPPPGKGAGKSKGKSAPPKAPPPKSSMLDARKAAQPRCPSAGSGEQATESNKVCIDADLLQERRAGLKKVNTNHGSKENVGPNNDAGRQENPVLRRLKERRRVVADERTEEFTQTTRWLPT